MYNLTMKKVAILYDFDKTLCDKDMQEYSLIPHLGYSDPIEFWKEVDSLSKSAHMDSISAYLYLLQEKFKELGEPLKKSDFNTVGDSINLYPGVETWFKRVNEIGKTLDLEIEHYVISSGMSEIIESVPVSREFKKIYACRYYYDENGIAKWPAVIVNYTTKTQYIFRINKQILDENNDKDLNTWVEMKDRPVPFKRMVYIADGLTDVPCMKLVREYGGTSIAVYNPTLEHASKVAKQLVEEKRADFMSRADYSESGPMETLMRKVLTNIHTEAILDDLRGKDDE